MWWLGRVGDEASPGSSGTLVLSSDSLSQPQNSQPTGILLPGEAPHTEEMAWFTYYTRGIVAITTHYHLWMAEFSLPCKDTWCTMYIPVEQVPQCGMCGCLLKVQQISIEQKLHNKKLLS